MKISVNQTRDQAFGRRSEKQSSSDRSNQLDDPSATPPSRPLGHQQGRPGPQRRDYGHLPVREETIELPEAERRCPSCGLPLVACGTEDAEQLEIDTVHRPGAPQLLTTEPTQAKI